MIVTRLVLEGGGVCNSYYTLYLVQGGPSHIPEDLITLVADVMPPTAEKHDPGELHCTMYFKQSQVPNPPYWDRLNKVTGKPMGLETLNWDDKGKSWATCTLTTQNVHRRAVTLSHGICHASAGQGALLRTRCPF